MYLLIFCFFFKKKDEKSTTTPLEISRKDTKFQT